MSNVYAFIPKEAIDILPVPIPYIIKTKTNIVQTYMLRRLLQEHPQLYYIGDLVNLQEREFISLLDDTFDELSTSDFTNFTKTISKQLLEYRLGFLGTIKNWESRKRKHELEQQYFYYYPY